MLLIPCPYCGERPEIEFRNAGEAHIARPADPSSIGEEAWAEYLYMRTNPKGLHRERWRHVHGCARFFNALRDTMSDKIIATYRIGEARPEPPPLALAASAPLQSAGEGLRADRCSEAGHQ